jgi:VWFA-related protein
MPRSLVTLVKLGALFTLFLILLAATTIRLRSQVISDDEIRFGSRPYVPPSANAIHVQTSAVQVPVVVRDSSGKAVAGLKQSDFQLFDDGHPVTIASFAVENVTPLPVQYVQAPQVVDASLPPAVPPVNPPPPTARYIAIFFDDLSMRTPDLLMARKATESFVSTSLKPGDRIGIFTTSTQDTLNFTDNVPVLLATLGHLVSHRRIAGDGTCVMTPYQASLITKNFDTHSDALDLGMRLPGCGGNNVQDLTNVARGIVGQAEQLAQETMGILIDVIHYLGRMPGHHMLVLASSGFLTETLQEKQDSLINEALSANVIINSIDAKGLVAENPGYTEDFQPLRGLKDKWLALFDEFKTANREVQNDPLAILAEGTGGHFYHNRNDLDVGLKEMASAPDVSYVLTFYPEALKRNSALHTLKVKLVDSHNMNITARRGYIAPSPNLTEPEKKKAQLDSAVITTDLLTALSAQVTTSSGKSAVGEPTLKVGIHLDAIRLPFETQGDRKVERLIYISALFDAQNKFVTGVEGVMDLRLKPETMTTLSTHGLDANLSVQAAPGNYRLRQVVQEVGNGRIATLNRNVRIESSGAQ